MSRFPVISASDLTDAQKIIEPRATEVFARAPSQIECYTPELADPWFTLAFAVTRQQRFSAREKELIIALLAEYDAPYVLYAHSQIAVASGLSQEQVQQAVHGEMPSALGKQETTMYSLALRLAGLHRPFSREEFEQAKKALGREHIVGLVYIVSGFIYVAMLTNVSDSGVPLTKTGRFVATKNPAFQ